MRALNEGDQTIDIDRAHDPIQPFGTFKAKVIASPSAPASP